MLFLYSMAVEFDWTGQIHKTNQTYEINQSDLILEQEEESKEEDFSPKLFDYIFLIDRSGSMSGTPITLAVKALKLFLHSLPIGSRFNVFSFGSNFSSLFLTSQPYCQESLDHAVSVVSTFTADMGGTEIFQPL